jgi:hypothetical protein
MRHFVRVVGLMALVSGITLGGGCTSKPALRDKPPPDPLLTSKKPVEGRPLAGDGRMAPGEDYAPPPRPVIEEEVRALGGQRTLRAPTGRE